ncbi:hypothetical protein PTI98_009721 [Pleurotus ostreatus]|nr:hypothetical protein PTI98_009721 [Pleurotus ostreatus]
MSTGCKAATSQNPTPARTIVLVPNIYMTIIEVDDGDARIMYSYGWSRGGSPPDLNHTISYTSTQGAQFTFVFLGTSVRVFGTLAATTFPNTSYSIDSGEPVLFFGEPPAQMQYRRNFFSSPDLKYGTHTLVGTCVDEALTLFTHKIAIESVRALKYRFANFGVANWPYSVDHFATLIRYNNILGVSALGGVSGIPLDIQIEADSISRCYHWRCCWRIRSGSDYPGSVSTLPPLEK